MSITEILKQLYTMFPDQFEDTDDKELKEFNKMSFPKGFLSFYSQMTPVDSVQIGRFKLLRLQDLINENIWDAPGEDLYEKGFPIIGADGDGNYFCLNMTEKNKAGEHDILLADAEEDYSELSAKEIRKNLKYIHNILGEFLAKELEFLKKSLKIKKSGK